MPDESNVHAASRMDTIYRLQRHIYDATRKFYLLGRDRLLQSLPRLAAPEILEIGCGTGRNLICLARRFPAGKFVGIDVSSEMLATARLAIARAGAADRISVAQIAAEQGAISGDGRAGAFDAVVCSYVLSMVPQWRSIIDEAVECVKPGGVLAVVDFKDQSTAPAWRRFVLLKWLALFHVAPRPEIEAGLSALVSDQLSLVRHQDIGSGYAYVLLLRKELGVDSAEGSRVVACSAVG